jgi:excinuclease ABC subunit C
MSMEDIKKHIQILPMLPGCYLMKNEDNKVIYVGKAKNLKNRVRSYFVGAHNEKTTRLVSEIRDFDFIITNSEHESLLLELNLIKQYSPKYNIRLMDDKTYPYIQITNERHPKLEVVRQKKPSGKVFGPYPNVYAARETVRMLNRIYPLRKCETLPKQACLYFHIGQCAAPCINPDISWDKTTDSISRFLKGDTKDVKKELEEEMRISSEAMQFEKAAEFRDMIKHIESTTEKQFINLNDHVDRDVIAMAHNDTDISIEIFKLRSGTLIDHEQSVFSYTLDPNDALISFLSQYYQHYIPSEVLCHESIIEDIVKDLFETKLIYPQIGDKKKMTDLAFKNAKETLEHYYMLNRHESDTKHHALDQLSKIIMKPIERIDVIDNAQLFGASPISAVIVYDQKDFQKKYYRKYHLKTAVQDDYQSMREVMYRRYQKALSEDTILPDLILVDGGIGQLHAAKDILEQLSLDIPIAGLKKNKKHQLEALVFNEQTIMLKTNTTLFKLLVRLSEEVHRFAISFHRQARSKQAFVSPLDNIEGIGPKRKALLVQTFGTLERMKEASDESLEALGISKAIIKRIKDHT